MAAQRANVRRALGKLPEALATHRRLAKAHPREPLLQVYLGQSLLAAGEPDGAEEAFEAALKLRADLTPAVAGRARVHLARASRAWEQDEPTEAQKEVEAALALAPRDRAVRRAVALLGIRSAAPKRIRAAATSLEQLGAGHAGQTDGVLLLAYVEALLRVGKVSECEQLLQDATGLLDKDDPRLAAVRAQWLGASDNPKAALELLEPLATEASGPLARNVTRLTAALAARLARKGEGRRARALFARAERGVQRLPVAQRREAQRVMVEALLAQRDYRHALRLLGTLIRGPDKDDPELRYQAAYCYYRLGNPDKAWGHLQALGRNKARGHYAELTRAVLFRQAGAHIRRQRGKEAKAVLTRLRALGAPDSDVLRHDMAVAAYLGGAPAGVAATLRSLAKRGTVREAELNLGVLADREGDSEAAYRHYRRYLRRAGEHAETVRAWARAKERLYGIGKGGTP